MENLLTVFDIARILQTTPTAVRMLRHYGRLPGGVRLGKRLYWKESDIEALFETEVGRNGKRKSP